MGRILSGTVSQLGLAGQTLWVTAEGRSFQALATTNISSRNVAVLIDDNGRATVSDANAGRPILTETRRFHKSSPRDTQENLIQYPQYWTHFGTYYLIQNTLKFAPGERNPDKYTMPVKYNHIGYTGGTRDDLDYVLGWWNAEPYAAFYLGGTYIYLCNDNEGWARIGETNGFAPWDDEEGDEWGIPVMFSKDGIKWNTPKVTGNFYTGLGLEPAYFYAGATSLFAASRPGACWSPDFQTIMLQWPDALGSYIVTGDYQNIVGRSAIGGIFYISNDKGKTWRAGITKEHESGCYSFGYYTPSYADGKIYLGVGDHAFPRYFYSPNRRILANRLSGLVDGSTEITYTFTFNQSMVDTEFYVNYADTTISGRYQITSVSANLKTITFDPPLSVDEDGEGEKKEMISATFDLFADGSDVRTLNSTDMPVLLEIDPVTDTTSVPISRPYPTGIQTLNLTTTTGLFYFAINGQPLEDTFLEDFYGLDPHFSPLYMYCRTFQWTGKNIAIGLLYGDDWLCPFEEDSETVRITPPNLPAYTYPPFQGPYENIYRPVVTSEKYRMVSPVLESKPFIRTSPKSLIGTWVSTSGIQYQYPENISPDFLSQDGSGYWSANINTPEYYYVGKPVGDGNSSVFVLKVSSTATDNELLIYTTNGRTYTLVPSSEIGDGISNVLGYSHSGRTDTEYGYIWYENRDDTVNVLYSAEDDSGNAYLFHAYTHDALNWTTKKVGEIAFLSLARHMGPFLGDSLKKQGPLKPIPRPTITPI